MKLTDFKRAVESIIKSATADLNIPVIETDLAEPIIRPSIKTVLDVGSSGRYNADYSCRTIHTDIYFFAKDRRNPRRENLDMIDRLAYTFLDGFFVADAYIPLLEDISFSAEDSVLRAQFDVEVYEIIEDRSSQNAEMMEHLHYTEEV